MVFPIINKKTEILLTRNFFRHSTQGISENACIKAVNILRTLILITLIKMKLLFSIYKILIFHLCPNMA